MSLAGLITEIDDERGGLGNLSSSLRLYVLRYLKNGKVNSERERSNPEMALPAA
jgi:predicted DNA-binding ribbon-helix-helix protein